MPETPRCLQDRYLILDELIRDLKNTNVFSNESGCFSEEVPPSNDGAAIRLMCNMWCALKENPNFDVSKLVDHKLECNVSSTSVMFEPSTFQCYPASSRKPDRMQSRSGSEALDKARSRIRNKSCCRGPKSDVCSIKSAQSNAESEVPLTKVLCDLTEAVTFDRKCTSRLNILLETEKRLSEQITKLEERERETQSLLKEADCMWSCMNDLYKKSIASSLLKQRDLRVKLTNIESNTIKWRNRYQDLLKEQNNLNKCHKSLKEKLNRKQNELKSTSSEVESMKNKIDIITKEIDGTNKSLSIKQSQGSKNLEKSNKKISELEKSIAESKKKRDATISEGKDVIKEVRTDLANVEKVLYDKQIEEHNLTILKDGLADEIIFLRTRTKTCDSNCKKQKKLIQEEIEKLTHEIVNFRAKCTKCSKSNDTSDIRKFCTDCARCLQQIECNTNEKELCYYSQIDECICMKIKNKLMENVLDNMYTVLLKYCGSDEAKDVADSVFQSLQKTKNGKLGIETKKRVQNFVLDTIRRDLNVTIVGGAIKTRCELDPDSYRQLILCIKVIKPPSVQKMDKAIDVRRQPCGAWDNSNECFCPKGPKKCICNTRAPKPPERSKSKTSRTTAERDKSDDKHLRPPSCKGTSCSYKKNATAAQCSINSIELVKHSRSKLCEKSENVNSDDLNSLTQVQEGCVCRFSFEDHCPIHSDLSVHPRERLIDEVLGRFDDETKSVERILSYDCIDLGPQNQMKVITCDSNITTGECNDDNKCIVIQAIIGRKSSPTDIAIMKHTSSGVYDVILDKEYNQELKMKLRELHKKLIYLSKISSHNYILHFITDDNNYDKEINAQVVKDTSNNIKIIQINQNTDEFVLDEGFTKICDAIIETNDVNTDIKDDNTDIMTYTMLISSIKSTNNSISSLKEKTESSTLRKSVTFDNTALLSDSHSSCSFFDEQDEKKDKNILATSYSIDYSSRRDIKILVLDYGHDINAAGHIVKESNYYAVYFNNSFDSKLYRLKSYLSVYKKCYLPVEMSDNDESLIVFLDKSELDPEDVTYALLKYSFSGKISIIIDEISMAKIYNRTKMLRSFNFASLPEPVKSINVGMTKSVSSGHVGLVFSNYNKLFPDINTEWKSEHSSGTFTECSSKRGDDNLQNASCTTYVQPAPTFSETSFNYYCEPCSTKNLLPHTEVKQECTEKRNKPIPDLPLQLPHFLRGFSSFNSNS